MNKYHFLKCHICHRIEEIHRVPEGSITAHRRKKHPNAEPNYKGAFHTWDTIFNNMN